MERHYATISVIGKDKSGVVAAVTQQLFKNNANIEALEEQVTRGDFSMTIQASWADGELDKEKMSSEFAQLSAELGMEIRFQYVPPGAKQKMALFVTKEPHCLEEILQAIDGGDLDVEPVCVISNHRVLEPIAKSHNIPFHYVPWDDRKWAEEKALELVDESGADFIVLARFMKILSPKFAWRHKNKIINIHPSLLPSFPGPQAYRQAFEHGVKIAGVTAHFVSMHLDEGPIIAQGSFDLLPDMELKDVVRTGQSLERKVLLKAIQAFLSKRLDVYWGQVREV